MTINFVPKNDNDHVLGSRPVSDSQSILGEISRLSLINSMSALLYRLKERGKLRGE